ncbi:hypothetical protein L1887_48155 [Cichorium endivia]|nr:hypothetical protein L1887_48155 [Cichorium endivia]
MLKFDEVQKHNSRESCWVVVHGNAYDVTEFLPDHPGGAGIILKYAGKDATEEYDPIHPPGTLEENLPKEKCLGPVDPSTIKKEEKVEKKQVAKDDGGVPPLSQCLNLYDFEIVAAKTHDAQVQFMQLYVNSNRAITENIIAKAEKAGIKGLFVTVDAPQLGRREKDMRMKFDDVGSDMQNQNKDNVDRSQGAARAISSFIDPSLSWDDLTWLRSVTKMPIVLKGVQTWEDAVRAAELGLSGVVLSNHGGRQLDFARSGIEVLGEVGSGNARQLYARLARTPDLRKAPDGCRHARRTGQQALESRCMQ